MDQNLSLIEEIRQPVYVIRDQHHQFGLLDVAQFQQVQNDLPGLGWQYIAYLAPIYPEWLGDQTFTQTHQVRFPYVVGEMANGIATAQMVIAAANAGLLGFFGAAGLLPDEVEKNIFTIQNALNQGQSWGSNLIHSPHDPHIEETVTDVYLKHQVKRVSASAYMSLTLPIVRYAYHGITLLPDQTIQRKNHVFAKISRREVAEPFMLPAPQNMLDELVKRGQLTQQEAQLARHLPVAQDITVESDSGGHTDNRPLMSLFSAIFELQQSIQNQYQYATPIRLGAAGGIGTPQAVASAFSLGAAYVMTGSINQAAVEAGLSQAGKEMLANAELTDVIMAPAADMFELGVQLQVLKRGSLFAQRAQKLYDLYSHYPSLEAIPVEEKNKIESQIFQQSLTEIWQKTEQFFQERNPAELDKARKDDKHRMALVFRWYLGLSSRWAICGEANRKADYQIWCGPAMGAFNRWVKGTFLEPLSARTIGQMGLNLLEGAAVMLRAHQLRTLGFPLTQQAFKFEPKPLL